MRPALKAALDRMRALLLAAAAGGVAHIAGHAGAAVGPNGPPVGAEQKSWAEAARRGTVEGYQRYLELFPTGRHAEEAFRLLIERSFDGRPVRRLVDVAPSAGPGGQPRELVVAAAALALY